MKQPYLAGYHQVACNCNQYDDSGGNAKGGFVLPGENFLLSFALEGGNCNVGAALRTWCGFADMLFRHQFQITATIASECGLVFRRRSFDSLNGSAADNHRFLALRAWNRSSFVLLMDIPGKSALVTVKNHQLRSCGKFVINTT